MVFKVPALPLRRGNGTHPPATWRQVIDVSRRVAAQVRPKIICSEETDNVLQNYATRRYIVIRSLNGSDFNLSFVYRPGGDSSLRQGGRGPSDGSWYRAVQPLCRIVRTVRSGL